MSLGPWARFDRTRIAVKLHTLLDRREALPAAVQITSATTQELIWLDPLAFAPARSISSTGARWTTADRTPSKRRAWYVTRAKRRMRYRRLHSHPVEKTTSPRTDRTTSLTNFYAVQHYPDKLRRVRNYHAEHTRRLAFLTNHFGLPASMVAQLHPQRGRWSCSSSGSSRLCGSKRSTDAARMLCACSCGSPWCASK